MVEQYEILTFLVLRHTFAILKNILKDPKNPRGLGALSILSNPREGDTAYPGSGE